MEIKRLHLGGTERKDGWLNMNAIPADNVDLVGDIKNLEFLEENTFQEIYASHILEHINQKDALATLKGINRILKPGGVFYISVPDLDTLCQLFIHPQLDVNAKYHVMRMMFGGQVNEFDFHYFGWNFEILGHFLKDSGFTNVNKVVSHGIFKDTSDLLVFGVRISLNVQCSK